MHKYIISHQLFHSWGTGFILSLPECDDPKLSFKKKINVDLDEFAGMIAKLKLFVPFPFQSQDYIFLSKPL